MRIVVALVISAGLLAGCGGSDEPKDADNSADPTMNAPAGVSLKDACPELEAAWVTSDAYVIPSSFIDKVDEMKATGDIETKNAMVELSDLIENEVTMGATADANGDLGISPNAEARIRGSIGERCAAVGSSAFQ